MLSHTVCMNQRKEDKDKAKESMRPSHSKHCSYAFVYCFIHAFIYACAIPSLVLLTSNGLHAFKLRFLCASLGVKGCVKGIIYQYIQTNMALVGSFAYEAPIGYVGVVPK